MNNRKIWRLIPLIQASGIVQMAIDSWLLEQHRQGQQPSVLRFYTWSKTTISLGYHQYQIPDFWQELTWKGEKIELVRRPTGGRAVLHQGDLTYMVVSSDFSSQRWRSYQQICQFLRQSWLEMGVNLDYGAAKTGYIHHPSCFATATHADLVSSTGDKLIGSAQLRQGKAILQHGSMVLNTDRELFAYIFGQQPPWQQTLWEQSAKRPSLEQIIDYLTQSASSCFGIELSIQPLTELEWNAILKNIA